MKFKLAFAEQRRPTRSHAVNLPKAWGYLAARCLRTPTWPTARTRRAASPKCWSPRIVSIGV